MKYLMLGIMFTMLTGCMTVDVKHCGPGNIYIVLDKAVDTLPIQADGNTVPVSAIP